MSRRYVPAPTARSTPRRRAARAPEKRSLAWHWSKTWATAAEEYADFGPVDHFYGPSAQSHQLFAVFDYYGKVSIEGGLGFGLTPATDHRVIKLMFAWDL